MKLVPEADSLATWCYQRLLNNTPAPYPLEGASASWKKGENWKIRLPKPKRKPRLPKKWTEKETFFEIMAAEKLFKRAAKRANAILVQGDAAGLKCHRFAWHLRDAMDDAQALLAELASAGDPHAVEALAFQTAAGAITLEKLTRSNLALVKPIASGFDFWPVCYSPHKDSKRETEALIARLGVGTAAELRVWGKWSNTATSDQPYRAVVGKYANRVGFLLRRLHADRNLRQVVKLNPEGWPAWVIDMVHLPKLTKATAPQWADVGLRLLTEAAGGKLTLIEELIPAGKSNVRYGKRQATTAVGRASDQPSRLESQIKARLREAFVARFGS